MPHNQINGKITMWAKTKKKPEPLHIIGENVKWAHPLWRAICGSSINQTGTSKTLRKSNAGVHPREHETKVLNILIFVVTFFTIEKCGKI